MLEIRALELEAGSRRLGGLALQLSAGEYVALMGPTGAGKTTLLEAICGLHPIESGQIQIDGVDITGLPPGQRSIGYVPQDLALFSTMSVADNLAYGLRVRELPRATIADRVHEIAGLLNIRDLLQRRPARLSGGEARRVALGRALCISPKLLLFDEPLAGLDDATRSDVCDAIETVHKSSGAAVVHVTHDLRDVGRLAGRLLVLRDDGLHEASQSQLDAAAETEFNKGSGPPGANLKPSNGPAPAAAPRATLPALDQP